MSPSTLEYEPTSATTIAHPGVDERQSRPSKDP